MNGLSNHCFIISMCPIRILVICINWIAFISRHLLIALVLKNSIVKFKSGIHIPEEIIWGAGVTVLVAFETQVYCVEFDRAVVILGLNLIVIAILPNFKNNTGSERYDINFFMWLYLNHQICNLHIVGT